MVVTFLGQTGHLTADDGKRLVQIAKKSELYWEAYKINAHFKLHVDAMKVLLDDLRDFTTAAGYASETGVQDVWKELGRGYLQYNHFS
jgi:clathrin heavy chain